MTALLLVRIKSPLELAELERRAIERVPRFREVPGLVQKFYLRQEATGDVCGLYFFEDHAALEAYRQSDLARGIASAYEATDVKPEVFDVMFPLHPDRGPSGG